MRSNPDYQDEDGMWHHYPYSDSMDCRDAMVILLISGGLAAICTLPLWLPAVINLIVAWKEYAG